MEAGCFHVQLERHLCLCFPSFQHDRTSAEENHLGRPKDSAGGAGLASATLVRTSDGSEQQAVAHQKEKEQSVECGTTHKQGLRTQLPIGDLPLLGKKMLAQGFDKETVLLVMDAWRPGTKKVYSMYIRKWMTFCLQFNVDVYKPKLQEVCKFLKNLSVRGLGYGALNAARSALATILPSFNGYSMGKHPTIFTLFKAWGKNSGLSLKFLTLKLAVLLLLVTSQRGQTILGLSLSGLDITEVAVFKLEKLLKHNRLGDALDTIILKPFDQCYRLCVVRALKLYIEKTRDLRGKEQQLLVSFLAPHRAISRDTLARWTVKVLGMSGVDVGKYKSHSTRGASASAANRLGVPINLLMKHAGWRSVDSFAKYYNKSLDQESETVGQSLLQNAV